MMNRKSAFRISIVIALLLMGLLCTGCDRLLGDGAASGGTTGNANPMPAATDTLPAPSDAMGEDEAHTHTFATDWSCDADAHWHTATCGHTDEASDRAAHRPDEGTVTRDATCTAAGERTYHCMDCGYVTSVEAIPATGHIEAPLAAVAPTCTETGLSDGVECGACHEVIAPQTEIPTTDHTPIPTPAVEPTCTETGLAEGQACADCDTVLVEQTPTEATGHTPAETPSNILPTLTEEGSMDSMTCITCREVLVMGRTIPALSAANSRYGYDSLGEMEDGEALQRFYDIFDEAVIDFHTDVTRDAADDRSIAKINYGSLGLTKDQAITVWMTYRSDNPLYYWLSTDVLYSKVDLYILSDALYVDGDSRSACNALISEKIFDLMLGLYSELDDLPPYKDSAYAKAEYFHDQIIAGMDYAYEIDGVTPQDDLWAHNIMGFFEYESGVCESYARTYQLLLNYSGVECLFVTGTAEGGGHAWNLAQMGNGGWYWFDVTWDDQPTLPGGMIDDYFCQTDRGSADFLSTHTPSPSGQLGIDYQYPLPERAETRYTGVLMRMKTRRA